MTNIYWEEHDNSSKKDESCSEKKIQTFNLCSTIQMPPKSVGGYDITGNGGGVDSIMFMMVKKPSWLHRKCTRLFLGWKWVDQK